MKQIELAPVRLPPDEPFEDDDDYPPIRPLPWRQICCAIVMAGGAAMMGGDLWGGVMQAVFASAEYWLLPS